MLLRERIYERALTGARRMLGRGWGNARLRRALRGRSEALERFEAWARTNRDPARPLVLVHAPSVGEALMARAIIQAARTREPWLQFAFTFFSPSAERSAAGTTADVVGYLPWDTDGDVARLLGALRPDAVAFIRTEIWPVLAVRAAERGARVLLLNAVLGAGSSRLRAPARFLLGAAYGRLDAVGAVARADADRIVRLGAAAERVRVTGDARFDQVLARIATLDLESPLLRLLRQPGSTVVAGSTWPKDEEHLLRAVAALAPALRPRIIMAPHQPSTAHVQAALYASEQLGLGARLLADVERTGTRNEAVIVVDRVGVLAELYALADVAYVGGGFGTAGLHSVAEPAALGVPVLFGPRHGNAREATELEQAGGGFAVTDAATLEQTLARLRADATLRQGAGAAAAAFVSARRGGAGANAALLLETMRGERG